MSQAENKAALQRLVLDRMDDGEPLPVAPKEEQRSYPTSVRIPVRLRAVLDDVRNELFSQGAEFTFNSFLVWCIQVAVEYTITTLRYKSPRMQQFLSESLLQKSLKRDREEYLATQAFVEEFLKDLDEMLDRNDIVRVRELLGELDRARRGFEGWRQQAYEEANNDPRVQRARELTKTRHSSTR